MPLVKNKLIDEMSPAVRRDSKLSWFNKLASLFDANSPGHIYGERIGHLILYANDHVRFNDVSLLLSKSFPGSLYIIKCEKGSGFLDARTDIDGDSSVIPKSLHYHCYITYSPAGDVDPDRSFKHAVFAMLSNRKKNCRFVALVKPAKKKMSKLDYSRNYKFLGYNLVTARNLYDKEYLRSWDVFYQTPSLRGCDVIDGGVNKRCLAVVNEANALRVLNWLAYASKENTAHGRKNCIIKDNRFTSKPQAN